MTLLHVVGEFLRNGLLQVPLGAAQVLFVLLPTVILIWVLRLPRSETTPPDGHGGWNENLKFGAALALLLQIAIYLLMA
ncbi:MAG TPA: hypothetical protein EYP14_09865 [Planctomycetaceae bacterium]|nr:hypothetical protein [Planctomycetaceae bacterium]